MAKRYYTFEELVGKTGYFKPGDTMGKHHCTLVPNQTGDRITVIGSKENRVVTIRPGDTLGYDCGDVWIVPSPDSYKDPIRRTLALAKISQKILEFSDEPVIYERIWHASYLWASHDADMGDTAYVLGKHSDNEVPDTSHNAEPTPPFDSGAGSYDREIVGGEVIVISSVVGYQATTSSQNRIVTKVVVRKNVDKSVAAEWLFELLTPEGQRRKEVREEIERLAQEKQDEIDSPIAEKLWRFIQSQSRMNPFDFETNHFRWRNSIYEVEIGYPWGGLLEAYRSGLLQSWADHVANEAISLRRQQAEEGFKLILEIVEKSTPPYRFVYLEREYEIVQDIYKSWQVVPVKPNEGEQVRVYLFPGEALRSGLLEAWVKSLS